MKTIVFFTSKGGGGKSTGSMVLAATLAYHMKKKVLLVSTDPQNSPNELREEDLQDFPDKEKEAYEIYEYLNTSPTFQVFLASGIKGWHRLI